MPRPKPFPCGGQGQPACAPVTAIKTLNEAREMIVDLQTAYSNEALVREQLKTDAHNLQESLDKERKISQEFLAERDAVQAQLNSILAGRKESGTGL